MRTIKPPDQKCRNGRRRRTILKKCSGNRALRSIMSKSNDGKSGRENRPLFMGSEASPASKKCENALKGKWSIFQKCICISIVTNADADVLYSMLTHSRTP